MNDVLALLAPLPEAAEPPRVLLVFVALPVVLVWLLWLETCTLLVFVTVVLVFVSLVMELVEPGPVLLIDAELLLTLAF